MKPVIEKARREWGIETSKDTIKRILKYFKMKWKRLRKIVGGKPEQGLYKRKKQILSALNKLFFQGAIDLRYLDESGFCLTPYVPYAWQALKEQQGIESKASKRLNVVGLLNKNIEILWRFMKYEWIEIEAYSKSEKFNQICRESFEIFWRSLCN